MHTLNPTTVRQKFHFLKENNTRKKLASPFDLSLFVIASLLSPHILYVLPCLLKGVHMNHCSGYNETGSSSKSEANNERIEPCKNKEARRETGIRYDHQSRCWWRFRLRTERTSEVNLTREKKHRKGNISLLTNMNILQNVILSYNNKCFFLTSSNHFFSDIYTFISKTYLNASNIGSRLRSAVSPGSLNHDFMGIALSVKMNKGRILPSNIKKTKCIDTSLSDASLTWMTSISSWRVVQNNYTGEIIVYYRQIFYVAT